MKFVDEYRRRQKDIARKRRELNRLRTSRAITRDRHRVALLANIEQAAAVEPPLIEAEDIVLGVLPLFHVYGLNAVLGQVLRQQARLVLAEGFDVEGTLELVEREAVTVVPVAPPVLAYWRDVDRLDERLASVRVVLSGSAPLASSSRCCRPASPAPGCIRRSTCWLGGAARCRGIIPA